MAQLEGWTETNVYTNEKVKVDFAGKGHCIRHILVTSNLIFL